MWCLVSSTIILLLLPHLFVLRVFSSHLSKNIYSGLTALANGDLGPFDQDFSSPQFSPLEAVESAEGEQVRALESAAEVTTGKLKAFPDDKELLESRVKELENRVAALEANQQTIKVIFTILIYH